MINSQPSASSNNRQIIRADHWGRRNADSIPPIPEPLVKWLDKMYPERCPSPKDSFEEIWMAAGRRDVVRLLLAHLMTQDSNPNVLK